MKIHKTLLPAVAAILLLATAAVAAPAPVTLDLGPDAGNPASPIMGDHLRFWSTITNNGTRPVQGLVAWISLVEVDRGNEQPMDLEDWSAHKAVAGATLEPGGSLRTDWPMRLIKSGDYRVIVSVTDRGGDRVYTSPTVQFHVRQKPMLKAGRVTAVAAGVPVFLLALFFVLKRRQRARQG
jgi:hypothetical protein